MIRWVVLALSLAGWLVAGAARAQSAPDVRLQADAQVVGVGDALHVQMNATSADGMPSDPRLASVSGFTLRGQNQSPSQTHMSINGVTSDRYTLTVDWVLQATRVGSYNLGPATVLIQGARVMARPIPIRVVPAGQAPARQRPTRIGPPSPFGMSPFDPWRSLFQDFGQEPEPAAPQPPPVDPRLALDAPRGQYVFLHAAVDKAAAVVGEQVTFSTYLYVDTEAPNLEQDDPHEAEADDFVKHPLLREDQDPPQVGLAQIGGRIWRVLLVRRWALFPLHAGDLTIGPMSVRISQGHGVTSTRTTESLHVQVLEPPVAGRPPGYAVGDVGHFALSAQVQPRQATQGGAVGVHVELSGSGNVPSSLAPPARADVEWLPPEVHDKVGATGQDGYGGTRSFDYVVRLKGAGAVDLGDLRLPFWNPEKKRYEVARATLGVVNVAPSPTAVASTAEPPSDVLPGMPSARDRLEGPVMARTHIDDSPLFWLVAVAGGPLVFGVAVAGRSAGRRAAGAWHRRRTSPRAELQERIASARAAGAGGDARAIDAAVERALQAATVVHAGVGVRGAVGASEIVGRLEGGGIARDLAERVGALFRECENARFSPETSDPAAARERWGKAQTLIRELEKNG